MVAVEPADAAAGGAATAYKGAKLSRSGRSQPPPLAPEEARVRAVADIVSSLIQGVRDGKDVDLNDLKSKVSRKYQLARAPKLVEIIAVRTSRGCIVLLLIFQAGLGCNDAVVVSATQDALHVMHWH